MKKLTATTLVLLSFAEFCHANPIGKVPADTKNYTFPKPAEKSKKTTPEKQIVYNETAQTPPPAESPAPAPQNDRPIPPPPPPNKIKPKRSYKPFKIDVAPQYSYLIVRSRKNRKLAGHLWGISGEMEYKKSNHIYGDANFLWNQGDIRARGHGHSWKEAVAEALIGYTTPIFHRTLMTIFAGFGYRRVMDHKSYRGLHPKRELNYGQYFVPCGLLFDFNYWDHWSVSLDLKAMPVVDEKVQLGNKPDVFYQLSKKMNYEAYLPITWKVVRGIKGDFDLSLIPFYKYWQFGGSSRLDLRSRTQTYWGVELEMGICF